jgi:hypothetical protein
VDVPITSPKVRAPLTNSLEKPDSQLPDKIKEDEVSSSEEALKSNRFLGNVNKEGMVPIDLLIPRV